MVGVPAVPAVLEKAVQDRLVLPMVVAAAQDKRVFDPDAHAGQVQARVYISTHAPHTKCDTMEIVKMKLSELFQPTHPIRSATT